MKKLTTFRVIPLFFLLAILVVSCVKDEHRETKPAVQPVLKSGSDFGLPIYMSQNTLIGEAEIYIENEAIVVNVLLNEGYMPSEAHLYAGADAPPSHAPGQFPYHWYAGDDYPISFVIDISDWWDGTSFDWYFALHLKIGNESAWLLPEEGGTSWLNNAGKPIGWGQYFQFSFEYIVSIDVITMSLNAIRASYFEGDYLLNPNDYLPVTNAYPDFTFCSGEDMYIDIESIELSVPLADNQMNAFYADPNDPIPFFYIKREGSVYKLIDGSYYAQNSVRELLIIAGALGSDITYSYTGTLLGENGTEVEVTINFKVEDCP